MAAPAPFLALAALLPAALNPGLLDGEALTLVLCGSGASVSIPLDNAPPDPQGKACCNKGCHSGESRKRTAQKGIDSPQ